MEQQKGGARGDAVRKRPGRGGGQAAKSRQRHEVPKTGSYEAKQEGAAGTKQQQGAEEGFPTPRTATSRAEEAAGAAAPRTGASGDKWLQYAPHGRIWDRTRSTGSPRTGAFRDKRRPNAADWIIRGGSRSTSRRTPDWIIRGQRAAGRPGLEHPGRNRQQEPQHPQHQSRGTRRGQMPRTGASGAEQEGAATTTGAGERWFAAPGRNARGASTRRGPHPPGRSSQGKEAARGKGNRRPRPRWCSEGDKTGSNAKDKAEEKQEGREVDEAQETQGSKDEDRAVVQQRNRAMDEAGVMQGGSCEEKSGVQHRS